MKTQQNNTEISRSFHEIIGVQTLPILILLIFIFFISACNNSNHKSDAYGNFETQEVIVSSEIGGKIIEFKIQEGKEIKAGETIGLIDTMQLWLKKQQVAAQKKSVISKSANVMSQVKVYQEQKNTLMTEKNRLDELLKDGAATSKQMDDIEGKLQVLDRQIDMVKTQNSTVFSEIEVLDKQIDIINDQINRCKIKNPINGRVLTKYAENHEVTGPGKALYKIADMNDMILRVYVDGTQLPKIKIGGTAQVLFDKDEETNETISGTVSWISDKNEFTPKIIQTKKERVNLVYAVKIKVKNDGRLKISMPGEVIF